MSTPLAFSMSNAASNTAMKAVWPALVPIVCTILFSRALVSVSRKAKTSGTRAMNPKNADTTDRFGPNPNFKTQYG